MQYNISNKDSLLYYYWNKLLLGIFIYELGNILYEFILNEHKIGRFISLIGILIFLFCACKLPKKSLCSKSSIIKPIFAFYLVINLITITRGLFESKIGDLLINPKYVWQYILPFIVFLEIPKKIFNLLYRWSFIYIITALLFCLYNFYDFYLNASEIIKNMIGWESYVMNRPQIPCMMSLPICLFLFDWNKLSITHRIIILITITLAILAALLAGRRSAAASVLFFLFIIFLIKIRKHLFTIIIISFLLYNTPSIISKASSDFSEKFLILSERLDKNTREGVETEFYKDFKEIHEWLFGRGISGTYKSPSMTTLGLSIHRSGIETGYLNLILHGGVSLLIPYIIILLYAILNIKRKVQSHFNTKAIITFIIFHIIWLYPAGTPQLGLEFIILWILISISLSPSRITYKLQYQP